MKCGWLLLGFLMIGMGLAHAQTMSDVFVITKAEGAQQFPDVAYNSKDNSFLAVWEHVRPADSVYEIHGVILNGVTGQPVGNPAILLSGEAGYQAPEVAYNSTANEFFLVAREVDNNMTIGLRLSGQGTPIGTPIEIGFSEGPTFFDPAARARVVTVTYNAKENEYFVGLAFPSAKILAADGSESITVDTFGNGTNPSAAWSSKSDVYLMAWEDRETRDTGNENLSACLISNAGEVIGDVIHVRDQEFAEESPRVVYNSDDDQFLVIWDERIGFAEGNNTATDTIGQIISTDGKMVGNPIPIEAGTAYTLRQDVDYYPGTGLYLVVWKGDPNSDFSFADIYGRFVKQDGSLPAVEFLIYDGGDDNTDEGNSEQYYDESKLPVTAFNPQTHQFLVVWEEGGTNRNPADRDIYARFIVPETPVIDWELAD